MSTTKRLKSPSIAAATAIAFLAVPTWGQPAPAAQPTPTSEPPATPPAEPPVTPGAAPQPAAPPPAAPPPAAPPAYTAPAWSYGAPPPGWAPAPVVPRRSPRIAHAHADRVVLLPTAYTHPEGTLYFSSNEIVLLQAGYALSDSTQVTLTGLPPVGEGPDKVFLLDLTLKNAFLRQGPLRLAGLGSVSGIFGVDEGNFVLGRVGAVAELCFDQECESSASLSSHMLLAGPGTMMVNGVGAIWRIADWGALLLEVDTLVPLGGEVGEYSGILLVPGFRFPYRTWSLDLAAMRPLDTEEEPELALIPWISFTYRFLP